MTTMSPLWGTPGHTPETKTSYSDINEVNYNSDRVYNLLTNNIDPSHAKFKVNCPNKVGLDYIGECNLAHLAVIKHDTKNLELIAQKYPHLLRGVSSIYELTPAYLAAMDDNGNCLKIIGEADPKSLTICSRSNYNSMTCAAYGKRLNALETLIDLDPKLLIQPDAEKRIATQEYLQQEHNQDKAINFTNLCIDHGIDLSNIKIDLSFINTQNIADSSNHSTIAHLAAIKGNSELLSKIASNMPNLLNEKDSVDRSPAMLAILTKHSESLKIPGMLNHKLTTECDKNGFNLATAAAFCKDLSALKILVQVDPSLLTKADNRERTTIKIYLEQERDINSIAKFFKLCLDYKIDLKNIRLKITFKDSNNVQHKNQERCSIAHFAVLNNDIELLKQIADQYPDLFILSNSNKVTPALMSVMTDKPDCLRIIGQANQKSLLERNSIGLHSVTYAAQMQQLNCLKVLIDLDYDLLTKPDQKGSTAETIVKKGNLIKGIILESTSPQAIKKTQEWLKKITKEDLQLFVELFGIDDFLNFINGLARYNVPDQKQGIDKYNSPEKALEMRLLRGLRRRVSDNDPKRNHYLPHLKGKLNFGTPPYHDLSSQEAINTTQETEEITNKGREHAYEFVSFLYDTLPVPNGTKPLMIRLCEAIAKDGINFIPAKDSNNFPGRGFCVNGFDLNKIFPRDSDYQSILKSWKELFKNENINQLLNDLEQSKFIATRGMGIIIPPIDARYNLPGNSLANSAHYSYVFNNEHFHNGEVDDIYLVPTEIINDLIPLNAEHHSTANLDSEFDINKISFTIKDLQKLADAKGLYILNIGSPSCFNSGLQNAYPTESKPFFHWEKNFKIHPSFGNEDEIGKHINLNSILSKSRNLSPIDRALEEMRVEPLKQLHGLVAVVSRRCQALKTLFNLIYTTAKKGLCGLSETVIPSGDLSLTMFAEAINWHQALSDTSNPKRTMILEKFGYPALCIADALNFSKRPYTDKGYIDTEDLTLRDKNGNLVFKFSTDIKDEKSVQKFKEFYQLAQADNFDLRLLPKFVL